MDLLSGLNNQQREALLCVDKHLRIIAGAGSGKTRVVTTRIAYLISELMIRPYRILAITFTNKAAREMKERVGSLLGDEANSIYISTIHSFCVRLLREDILAMHYPRNFTIIDSDDAKNILKEAYKQYEIDHKKHSYNQALSYISHKKMNLISYEECLNNPKNEDDEKHALIYEYYQKRLNSMFALDFDDLLLYVYQLLKTNQDVRKKWQNRFDYIHVDEFQDVDYIQYQIISMLVGKHCKLCVVGDPDQTIYTWRGAQVDIILNFERDFDDVKTVILNENYRSTTPILNVSNALIAHNQNRIKKELFTRNESDELVVHYCSIDDNEAGWVAKQILELVKNGAKYQDIAILYRSNYLSRGLERACLDERIPYTIYGGIRFYDRKEIKDALSYLKLLLPNDELDPKALSKDLAMKRIINTPKRSIGEKSIQALEAYAKVHDCNLYDAIKNSDVLKGKAKNNAKQLVDVIENLSKEVDNIAMDLLLEKVLDDCGYIEMLENDSEIERIENIKELIEDMTIFMNTHDDASLADYLQEVSLYTDKDQIKTDSVSLMTIHAAKGLEFDYIFVYNLCEGVFPSERSVKDGGLEEERRLAYVAFTRAKKKLFLSNSSGYSYVLDSLKFPSRFLKELPSKYIEDLNRKERERREEKEQSEVKKRIENEKQMMVNRNMGFIPKKQIGKGKLRKGDIVEHATFGEGVIINVEDELATIAFNQKFGVRKIMVNHPSVRRK